MVAAEAAYPERQAAALLTNASVLKVSLRRDSFLYVCDSRYGWQIPYASRSDPDTTQQ